jgi:hypothetical protein
MVIIQDWRLSGCGIFQGTMVVLSAMIGERNTHTKMPGTIADTQTNT